MAYADPPAGGIASDNVAPVTAAQDPTLYLTHVGATSGGLPTGSDGVDSLITRAYDLTAFTFLRRKLLFDEWATVAPTRQSHNGAVIQMNFVGDIDDDPAKAVLEEDYDVLPTPLASYKTDLTMLEYGRTVTRTNLVRGLSMIPIDPVAAERVGRNAGGTIDRLALAALLASGGIKNDGTAGGAVVDVTVANGPSDTLRAAAQYFRENNVDPMDDGFYRAALTPAAETALRKEADAAGWRYWQANDGSEMGGNSIVRGFVGNYEGFKISVSTGVPSAQGGIFGGKDALAKVFPKVPGYGPYPQVVVAPVVDRLRRFASVGWLWLGGYGRFRAEAVVTGNPGATA